MSIFTKPLTLALMLGLAPAAFAQETPTPAETPAAEAPTTDAPQAGATPAQPNAEAGDGPGSTYVAETFGDWQLQCIRTPEGNDPCQLYQLLKDEQGNSVADISVLALTGNEQVAAGATIMTPLETLLTQGVIIQIDSGEAKAYPFTYCTAGGCVARLALRPEELESFKRGNNGKLAIAPVAAPERKVELAISLKGFTAGYEALSKTVSPAE